MLVNKINMPTLGNGVKITYKNNLFLTIVQPLKFEMSPIMRLKGVSIPHKDGYAKRKMR